MSAKESKFQRKIKARLETEFPGCYVMKNDAGYLQGIPDLTVLYRDKWAMLEVKRNKEEKMKSEKKNPNQVIRVNELNKMSYAAFIYPENEEDVFDDLKRTFRSEGEACDI